MSTRGRAAAALVTLTLLAVFGFATQSSALGSASTTAQSDDVSPPAVYEALPLLFGGTSLGATGAEAALAVAEDTGADVARLDASSSPVVSSIDPASPVLAGGDGFTLTVSGSDFAADADILWNDVALSTTRESSTTVSAPVSSSLIATVGSASIAVGNPVTGGYDTSNSLDLQLIGPTISSLDPSSTVAGGAGFSLTVNGSGFATSTPAVVYWGSTALTTTASLLNPTAVLTAVVPASLIASPGTAQITVRNFDTVASSAVTFTVAGPAITAITPATGASSASALSFVLTGTGLRYADSPAVALVGTGTNTGTTINATGVTLVTPTVDGGAYTITGSLDLTGTAASSTTPAPAGTYDLALTYSYAGSTVTVTKAAAFIVTGSTLTSVSPTTTTNGQTALAFTLTGTGLSGLTTPVVTLKGPGTTGTTVVTATSLVAASGGLTMTGMFSLTSPSVAPSGLYDVVITYGTSKTLTLSQAFTVTNAAPLVTSVSPSTVWAGSVKPTTLTVGGSGFVPATALLGSTGSVAQIGTRTTTDTNVVSGSQLTVPLLAGDISAAGTVPITVVNPTPGGGTSTAASLTVAADASPPVSTISGADTKWHNSPVTLTVTATDSQSGVQMTQYGIGTVPPWTTLSGSMITVPAPADHSGDGVKAVSVRSIDWCNTVETPAATATVKIDTLGPKTSGAVPSTVKKGAKVKFGYRADDTTPKCTITLKIKKASNGSVMRTYSMGSTSSGTSLTYVVAPGLAKGSYKYYVYAIDQAGNGQSKLGVKSFTVK